MSSVTLILGGARSGKSDYALKLAKKIDGNTLFLATAVPFDSVMEDRIKKHQKQRPKTWKTIEQYKNLSNLSQNQSFNNSNVILFDCITLFVTNQMLESDINWEYTTPGEVELIENNIRDELNNFLELTKEKDLIIVSNEVGLGVVPANNLSNYFRDIMGRINQLIAKQSNNVIFMIAGIPITIKGELN